MATPSLSIRRAFPSERSALIALQWRASLTHETYRADLLAHPDAIDLPAEQIENGLVWVGELDGAMCGFSVITPLGDSAFELDGLFVEPPLWRKGLGRILVRHCAEIARKAGASALFVSANPDALAFYGACGFYEIGSVETRFGAAPRMRLDL